MKKRTKKTIILFVILGIGIAVYSGLKQDPRAQELREMGVRAVFNDEQKFAEELQKDGLLYGYGKLTSEFQKSDLDLSSLEFRGEDREQALKKALEGIPDTIAAAEFVSCQAFFESKKVYIQDSQERKRLGTNYKIEVTLEPDIHDVLKIVAPKVQFLNQEFETNDFFFRISEYEKGYWTKNVKEGEYVIFSDFISATGIEGLLEVEIKDGKILTEKTKFYKYGLGCNDFFSLEELAGKKNFFSIFIGVFIFMGFLCWLTIWIQNKFFD